MDKKKYPPVNVLTAIRGFPHPTLRHHITPYRFSTGDGRKYHIKQIRQAHKERVGGAFHYHYVVITREDRYFHLVFDTSTLIWRLVQEVDEELFFS